MRGLTQAPRVCGTVAEAYAPPPESNAHHAGHGGGGLPPPPVPPQPHQPPPPPPHTPTDEAAIGCMEAYLMAAGLERNKYLNPLRAQLFCGAALSFWAKIEGDPTHPLVVQASHTLALCLVDMKEHESAEEVVKALIIRSSRRCAPPPPPAVPVVGWMPLRPVPLAHAVASPEASGTRRRCRAARGHAHAVLRVSAR